MAIADSQRFRTTTVPDIDPSLFPLTTTRCSMSSERQSEDGLARLLDNAPHVASGFSPGEGLRSPQLASSKTTRPTRIKANGARWRLGMRIIVARGLLLDTRHQSPRELGVHVRLSLKES